jgi:hypothetical protein
VTVSISRRVLAIVLGVVALALVALVVLVVNPFGESVSERVSSRVGADADCTKAGLRVLAGERETVYRCSYRNPHFKDNPYTVAC